MPGAKRFAVPAPGDVLSGKYRIERLLGEGGMAFVFSARDEQQGRHLALKVLAPDFARDAELVARFNREAQAVYQLRSENVVRMYEVAQTPDGLPYIAMELLDGRDLEAELAERGRIPVDEAVDYILQACAAMREAHAAGIVHRDLKPANLFVDRRSGERLVKVLDFGISKVRGAARLTAAGAVMGTVLYMSPEQIRASKDVDERTDIWSLGIILYELVAGRAPFEGTSHQVAGAILQSEVPDIRHLLPVPEGVANTIHAMLQSDLSRRIPNVQEVIRLLGPFARPGSPGARIAGQMSSSSKAVQPFTMPFVKGGAGATVPIGGPLVTRPPPSSPGGPSSSHHEMGPRPSVPDPEPPRGPPVWLGALIGLVAAALVVAGLAAYYRARVRPATARPGDAPSAHVVDREAPQPSSGVTPTTSAPPPTAAPSSSSAPSSPAPSP